MSRQDSDQWSRLFGRRRPPYEKRVDEADPGTARLRRLQAERDAARADALKYRSLLERAFRQADLVCWDWNGHSDELHEYMSSDSQAAQLEVPLSPTNAQFIDLIHPADRERLAELYQTAVERGIGYRAEYRVRTQSGEWMHLREIAEPVFDAQGHYLRHEGTDQDISEVKRAEQALRRSERRYRNLYRHMPVMMFSLDSEARLVEVNDRWQATLGYERGDSLGLELADFMTSDSADTFRQEALPQLKQCGELSELESTFVTRDGRWIDCMLSAVAESEKGDTPDRILGFLIDATVTKSAEAEIRKRDAWLRAILENAPLEIVIKDTQGRIMAVSRDIVNVLSIDLQDAIGKTSADFLPEEIARVYMEADRKVLQTGRSIQHEVVERVDGEVQHMLNSKFPLRDDRGEIIGVCSLTTDITEMRRMEAKLHHAQKMETVGQLTGGIAHDFNNLLAIVMGNLEDLADRLSLDDPAIRSALRATTRGAELTQRLLMFARRQALDAKAVDLNAIVCGMEDLLRRTLGEDIAVEIHCSDDLWPVLADAGQVENALLNLALNARDAMTAGGCLRIETANVTLDHEAARHVEGTPGDYVVLVVADDGTGIEPTMIGRIFEPFFTTKELGGGSGLGLSMVYGFAKESGGYVTAESTPGQGTCVRLYLPRTVSTPTAVAKAQTRDLPASQGESILVVEDNPDVLALAVSMLESLDYRVLAAENGKEALRVLEEGHAIDLMLTDVALPGGLRGPELAQRARAGRPGLKILFMSGYAGRSLDDSYDLDPERLISKPFRKRDLASRLRAELDAAEG